MTVCMFVLSGVEGGSSCQGGQSTGYCEAAQERGAGEIQEGEETILHQEM